MSEEANVAQENETVVEPQEQIDPNVFAEMKAENERLKAFHDKVTKEKQEAVTKAKAEADRAAKEKAEAEGNYKELLALKEKEFAEKLKTYEDKLTSYEAEQLQNKINSAASVIANQLTKHSGKAADLTEKLAKRIKITEEGLVVTDEKGKIISDKLDSLSDYAKKTYDWLCDGLQSTGTAGIKAVTPTGTDNHDNLSPIERLNRARGIK